MDIGAAETVSALQAASGDRLAFRKRTVAIFGEADVNGKEKAEDVVEDEKHLRKPLHRMDQARVVISCVIPPFDKCPFVKRIMICINI